MATPSTPASAAHESNGRPDSPPDETLMVHGFGLATGTTQFIDDEPPQLGEVLVGVVIGRFASGRIRSINIDAALRVPAVVGIYTYKDLPGPNRFGPLGNDEFILPEDVVLYAGQPIVVIAAESKEALDEARRLVVVDIEETPAVLSFDEMAAHNHVMGWDRCYENGDPDGTLAAAPHRLSGTLESDGQEHFYFETQTCRCFLVDGVLILRCSTQNPTEIQHLIAHAFGLDMSAVKVDVPRMGGGFGGKETQAALPAFFVALVTWKTRRTSRIVYDRKTDMVATGKRHPVRTRWEAGFMPDGEVIAYTALHELEGGAATDLSPAVRDRLCFHGTNGYFVRNHRIKGVIYFSNRHPTTAYRGFGGPQGILRIENVMEAVAAELGLDPFDVRMRNLYSEEGGRNVTPFGQPVERFHLRDMMLQLAETSDYRRRQAGILEWNATDRQFLHGIAIVPEMFGISFTTKFLNQAGAHVVVYLDGSVRVSTGATNMGQGTDTHMQIIAARALGISPSKVRIGETSTASVPNTSPSAASATTDLNGAAVEDACSRIVARLRTFAANRFEVSERSIVFQNDRVFTTEDLAKGMTFAELCGQARLNRVALAEQGFYATPDIGVDPVTGRGNAFRYFSFGAACVQVKIDRFTGETFFPRTDIIYDPGVPISRGIYTGQVIGGFVQGHGWAITENLVYQQGRLISDGPTTYKIPGARDVSPDFRLDFYETDNADYAVLGSKAKGEPPFVLGIASWCAVRNALLAHSPVSANALRLPATGEEIMRCMSLARKRATAAV